MSTFALHTRLAADHGFTLIETLVAMIAGVVVTGALSMVFIVALHQTSRLTDSVQASQLGRTAMTHVIDELRSACIARGYTPVQKESTASQLIFRDAYGEESIIPNANEALAGTGSFQHEIEWNSSAHTLTDFIYPSERGSEWPAYKFPVANYKASTGEATNATPAKGVLIASHVSPTKSSSSVFKYYKYGVEATESETTALSTLTEVVPPGTGLTESEAATIAAVTVSFSTAPLDNQTKLSRSAEFSNEVTFAFGTPSSEATINDQPCE